ncbi:MAG: MYXO-CTERM sorting domain-containing protein [Myxococcota bacterium]
MPWIATSFGTARPSSSTFLLHVGLGEGSASGTPVLLIPGAGDNGPRAYSTLAPALDLAGRPVYALTFAHPHGDVFLQAEVVADALAAIEARTGAPQVDVVAHSKGGIAAAVYAASGEADALGSRYGAHGTHYRGDIRKLVLAGVPMGGIDTSYRWSGLSFTGLDADTAVSPPAWSTYYPSGSGAWWLAVDLSDQDFLSDGRDLFPGQRQVLARQPAPLPGSRPWLGLYAAQQDWYTTYEGGFGFVSWSDGIDAAIADGGDLVERLASAGIDPDIEVYQLVGRSPLLVNGDEAMIAQFDVLGALVDYDGLAHDLRDHGIDVHPDAAELQGLEDGKLVLGEISADSDGVVFATSAGDDRAITARGGRVVERYDADIAHLDLLYASPLAAQQLYAAADAGGPGDAWLRSLGARYEQADSVGWIVGALADDTAERSGGGSGDDRDDAARDLGEKGALAPGLGGCDTGGAPASGLALLLGAALLRRRR